MFELKVNKFIKMHKMFYHGATLIVAVSGGIDSIALLSFLHKKSHASGWKIVVVHMDHMFRRNQSRKDYLFVEEHCRTLGVVFIGESINIPEQVDITKENPQLVARVFRYRFFNEVMKNYENPYLVLGHHLDDQAENVLMNLTRGVVTPENISIPIVRSFGNGTIVRPLLCVTKKEIRDYGFKNSLVFREDESNNKLTYTRNRVRAKIVPLIKEENAQALVHISDFAQKVQNDGKYLHSLAFKEFKRLLGAEIDGSPQISISEFKDIDKPLQYRVIILLLDDISLRYDFIYSHNHVESLLGIITCNKASAELRLDKNVFAVKSYDKLFFWEKMPQKLSFELELVIPGVTFLPNGDCIETSFVKNSEDFNKKGEFTLDTCLLELTDNVPVLVRNKRSGDRIFISGFLGSKKLKKVFIDKKIPRYLRESLAVVTLDEKIVWVPNVIKYLPKIVDKASQKVFLRYTSAKENDCENQKQKG